MFRVGGFAPPFNFIFLPVLGSPHNRGKMCKDVVLCKIVSPEKYSYHLVNLLPGIKCYLFEKGILNLFNHTSNWAM